MVTKILRCFRIRDACIYWDKFYILVDTHKMTVHQKPVKLRNELTRFEKADLSIITICSYKTLLFQAQIRWFVNEKLNDLFIGSHKKRRKSLVDYGFCYL